MEPTDNNDENKDGSEPKKYFPPGFEHVEKIVQEGKLRMKDIDEQINGLKGEKGPAPQYNPPGFIKSRSTMSKEQQTELLKQQKEQVQASVWKEVDEEAKKTNPNTAKAIRDKTLEEIYPDLSEGEKNAAKMDISQDYMKGLLEDKKGKVAQKLTPQSEKAPDSKSDASHSMSFKFSQTLSYPNLDDGAGGGGSSSKGKVKEKDDPEP